MNEFKIFGRVARDPQVDTTKNGKRRARVTVAADRAISRANRAAGQKPAADFIPLTAWEAVADAIARLHKGDQVLVIGSIITGSYIDANGDKQYTIDHVIKHVEYGAKAGANAAVSQATQAPPASTTAPASQASAAQPAPDVPIDDDIPF